MGVVKLNHLLPIDHIDQRDTGHLVSDDYLKKTHALLQTLTSFLKPESTSQTAATKETLDTLGQLIQKIESNAQRDNLRNYPQLYKSPRPGATKILPDEEQKNLSIIEEVENTLNQLSRKSILANNVRAYLLLRHGRKHTKKDKHDEMGRYFNDTQKKILGRINEQLEELPKVFPWLGKHSEQTSFNKLYQQLTEDVQQFLKIDPQELRTRANCLAFHRQLNNMSTHFEIIKRFLDKSPKTETRKQLASTLVSLEEKIKGFSAFGKRVIDIRIEYAQKEQWEKNLEKANIWGIRFSLALSISALVIWGLSFAFPPLVPIVSIMFTVTYATFTPVLFNLFQMGRNIVAGRAPPRKEIKEFFVTLGLALGLNLIGPLIAKFHIFHKLADALKMIGDDSLAPFEAALQVPTQSVLGTLVSTSHKEAKNALNTAVKEKLKAAPLELGKNVISSAPAEEIKQENRVVAQQDPLEIPVRDTGSTPINIVLPPPKKYSISAPTSAFYKPRKEEEPNFARSLNSSIESGPETKSEKPSSGSEQGSDSEFEDTPPHSGNITPTSSPNGKRPLTPEPEIADVVLPLGSPQMVKSN